MKKGILFTLVLFFSAGIVWAQSDISDPWITLKTKVSILSEIGTQGTDINVDTVNGKVTLHGKVSHESDKKAAEKLAGDIQGVREVRNLLQVVPPEREDRVEISDSRIRDRVSEALEKEKSLQESDISVQSVNDGVVLLSGTAKNLEDHLRALIAARGVEGVRSVRSQIQTPDSRADREGLKERRNGGIGETMSDAYITSATKMRLLANPDTPSLDINVDTENGKVTLFGTVVSDEARLKAEKEASQVSGVKEVINLLEVEPSEREK
jgi:osmotically-inducible protein OsmY